MRRVATSGIGRASQQPVLWNWNPATEPPQFPKGQEYFQLAVKRANGKVYSFPAVYCNDNIVYMDALRVSCVPDPGYLPERKARKKEP
jgi:hypothetical protein